MEQTPGERPVTVDNTGGVVVVGDGNRVVTGAPPAVRSGYREQLRRIAPRELSGREAELAELAAFCRTGSGYGYWRADAWAGKTALMAVFALAPPPGVRLVPFFVTARWGAQNDAVAFVDVVVEQLAELAGEPLPALLTPATREAHLLRLHRAAGRVCAARGERLVLLVDGLDEDRGVTTGTDAHSIAALLPPDGHVIVSGRLHPPLPPDVPDTHPLRDPAAVRILAPSPAARAIRTEAERELKHLLTAEGAPHEILALVTAAGGGLTADDLAELTGEVPYRVRDVLRTGPGRTFARRGEAYLLAHEELGVRAREMLGTRALDRRRNRLHAWADEWRRRGWPEGTPEYLLRSYGAMLRTTGDVDRMVACALDAVRHDRMRAATGGDGPAAAEVRAAGEALLARGDGPDLVPSMLRLAMRRDALALRVGTLPAELAGAWAAAGEVDRALALAEGESPLRTVRVLAEIATRLLDAGDRAGAAELVDRAERLALTRESDFERHRAAVHLTPLLLATGAHRRAERTVLAVPEGFRDQELTALVRALCEAGEFGSALRIARRAHGAVENPLRMATVTLVCRALLAAGRADEAEDAVTGSPEDPCRAALLLHGADALREAGYAERADALRTAGLAAAEETDADDEYALHAVARALADAGEFARLTALGLRSGGGPGEEEFAEQLARARAFDRALAVVGRLPDDITGRRVRRILAEELIAAGRGAEAEPLLDGLPRPDAARGWELLAARRAEAGDWNGLRTLLRKIGPQAQDRVVGTYVRGLVRRGDTATAVALARTGGPTDAVLSLAVADELLACGDRATAVELLAEAERLRGVPPRGELVRRIAGVAEALAPLDGLLGTARAFLAEDLLRGSDGHPLRLVDALLAVGETDRAEALAVALPFLLREPALVPVVEARVAAGAHEAAIRLVEGSSALVDTALLAALRALAETGAWRHADRLATDPPDREAEGQAEALVALALARAGRVEEALDRLRRAEAAVSVTALPDLVRAQLALGRRADAQGVVRATVTRADGPDEVGAAARALVLVGRPDEALALVRSLGPDEAPEALLGLARDLVAAGEHARAEEVLAGLHGLGRSCADVLAALAAALPDTESARARRCTALALHLGQWYDVLPAVLRWAPEVLPEVLAEGERLRRALQV
ncbi:hypothetical protein ACIRQF_20525 [Streptomyces sp. NPDC101191]|uniref:hypothetical protein n=1 Tax=Streptomyces sp. NPDC101191 TaxID=3366126 RepID=UPI00382A1A9E